MDVRGRAGTRPGHRPPLGVIDLTGEMASVHPHSLAVAMATAHAVQAQLAHQLMSATLASPRFGACWGPSPPAPLS